MTTPELPVLDLLSPQFVQDPSAMIGRMHAEQPIAFDPRLYGWLVGAWDDVKTLEREPKLISARAGYVRALTPPELQEKVTPLVDWYAEWMVMRDGADHKRLRRLAASAFTPRNIAKMQARIDEVVAERVDAAVARGEMEVVSELAYPLPRIVICEMLGIPAEDMHEFEAWTPTVNLLLAGALTTQEVIDQVSAAREGIQAYFGEVIAQRRKQPREGEIISELVAALEADDAVSEQEVIDLITFIMAGAYDTTAHLIANGLNLLLRHPEQQAAVRADPTRIDGWIEETLRYEPSLAINTRAVAEPFEVHGNRFEPGQMVYFVAPAANRDPAKFPEPDRFDITRDNAGEHIAFGFGPHFCIGAPLARLEARRAFLGLITRTQSLSLPEQEIQRIPNMVVRGLQSLRVTMT